ncbi:MAG: LEA type 2 family protein [Gammaproteobacteria bacterium]
MSIRLRCPGPGDPIRFLRPRVLLGCVLACVALTGCAGLTPNFETPRVSLVTLEPLDMQLFEQRYSVQLRIQNPNDTDLRIKGLDYEIELNGETFGAGVSNAATTIPAYGESILDLTMVSNLARVVEQFDRLFRDDTPTLDYAIRGKLSLDGVLLALPFSREGSLSLPGQRSIAMKTAYARLTQPRTQIAPTWR